MNFTIIRRTLHGFFSQIYVIYRLPLLLLVLLGCSLVFLLPFFPTVPLEFSLPCIIMFQQLL